MSKPLNPVEKFFNRYNFVTFVVIASLMLAGIIYACFNTYISAITPESSQISSPIPENFDKVTADKIDKLHTSDNPPKIDTPSNQKRSSPFVE